MLARRLLLCMMVVTLTTVPVLGFAGDDLSASTAGKHHHGRLGRAPHQTWRTAGSLVTSPAFVPKIAPTSWLATVDTVVVVPLLVRVPFVPPRA